MASQVGTRLWQAFARLFPSLFEEGRAKATLHSPHLPWLLFLPLWELTSQLSGLFTLLPGKPFPGVQENPITHTFKHLGPEASCPSFWDGGITSTGSDLLLLQQREETPTIWSEHVQVCSFFGGHCHSRELLVQDLSQGDAIGPRDGWKLLSFRLLISKITNQQTKFPTAVSSRLKEEIFLQAHQLWYSGIFIFSVGK